LRCRGIFINSIITKYSPVADSAINLKICRWS